MNLVKYFRSKLGRELLLRSISFFTGGSVVFAILMGCLALVHIYPYPVYAIATIIYLWYTYMVGHGAILDYQYWKYWRKYEDEESL